jgi:catechol 2,3-dioxygenase-like lactoylglutathione lyase family enzyme
MVRKIATVAVYVEDQEAAERFWTEKLGFEVSKKLPMGPKAYWIELGPKGAESYITLFPKFMMPDWNERKPSLVFETDDIQKTYEELKAKGVDIDPPKEMGFGIFTQFRDIDGNEFGLRQHK